MEKHRARVHNANTVFMCQWCEFECCWSKQYYEHVRETHQVLYFPPFLSLMVQFQPQSPYHCDQCGLGNFARLPDFLAHRLLHSKLKISGEKAKWHLLQLKNDSLNVLIVDSERAQGHSSGRMRKCTIREFIYHFLKGFRSILKWNAEIATNVPFRDFFLLWYSWNVEKSNNSPLPRNFPTFLPRNVSAIRIYIYRIL